LWREEHFQVKIYKTLHVRATFGGSDDIEGSLEVKRPIIWSDGTNEKQSRAEAERRERLEKRRSEEKKSEERRCRCVEKLGKSRNSVFFQ